MGNLNKLILITFLIIAGCKKDSFNNPQNYLTWINNPSNGLVKNKIANGVMIQVKYLPHEYLRLNQEDNEKSIDLDISQLTFVLTFAPTSNNEQNIVLRGIGSENEFKKRVLEMNFGFADMISLNFNKKLYKPTLSNLENTYNIKSSKNLNLVFNLSLEQLKENSHIPIDLLLIDEIFETGIHHFIFQPEDLLKVSKIN